MPGGHRTGSASPWRVPISICPWRSPIWSSPVPVSRTRLPFLLMVKRATPQPRLSSAPDYPSKAPAVLALSPLQAAGQFISRWVQLARIRQWHHCTNPPTGMAGLASQLGWGLVAFVFGGFKTGRGRVLILLLAFSLLVPAIGCGGGETGSGGGGGSSHTDPGTSDRELHHHDHRHERKPQSQYNLYPQCLVRLCPE